MFAVQALTKKWFYALLALFVSVSSFMLINEQYWFLAVPVALWFVYFITFSIDKSLLFITAITPLSILVDLKEVGLSFTLPTEPLLMGMMVIFFIKLLVEGRYDTRAFFHPITLAIIAYVLWMGFTTLSSTMPFISLKFLLSNLWFISCFYFIGLQLFREKKNLHLFLWLYFGGLVLVMIYSIFNHSLEGFTKQSADWAAQPFVINHGIYGAMLAFFVPFVVIYLLQARLFTNKPLVSFLMIFFLVLITVAIILSYTRAAWVSVLAALAFYAMLRMRIQFRTLLLLLGLLIIGFLSFQTTLLMKLEKNKTDSATDMSQHVKSISNIRTDASNLERLNRWSSAYRMFKEKPMLGWGPGTYMFKYAPFQKPKDKTIVSTNMADIGGIHSEYLGPLVEMGIPGFLLFLLLIGVVLYRAMHLYYTLHTPYIRSTLLMVLLGLITYLTHGFLNNYLDIDKTALLFWGFVGMIAAIDLYHRDPVSTETQA
jgi:O-antigen ligase